MPKSIQLTPKDDRDCCYNRDNGRICEYCDGYDDAVRLCNNREKIIMRRLQSIYQSSKLSSKREIALLIEEIRGK